MNALATDGWADDDVLIDAAEVARRFGVSRHFVYEHAVELGAIRLGTGPRPRLRFDPTTVLQALRALGAKTPAEQKVRKMPPAPPPRSEHSDNHASVLPIFALDSDGPRGSARRKSARKNRDSSPQSKSQGSPRRSPR